MGTGVFQPEEPVLIDSVFCLDRVSPAPAAPGLEGPKAAGGPQQFGEGHRQPDACSGRCRLLQGAQLPVLVQSRLVKQAIWEDRDGLPHDVSIAEQHSFPE